MTGEAERHVRGDRRLLASIRAMQHIQDGPVSSSASNPSPAPQPTGTGADDNTGTADTIAKALEIAERLREQILEHSCEACRDDVDALIAALVAALTVGCGEPAPYPPHGAAGSPQPNGSRECDRPAPRDPWTGSRRGAGQKGTVAMTDNTGEPTAADTTELPEWDVVVAARGDFPAVARAAPTAADAIEKALRLVDGAIERILATGGARRLSAEWVESRLREIRAVLAAEAKR